jgi:hypothetical protein
MTFSLWTLDFPFIPLQPAPARFSLFLLWFILPPCLDLQALHNRRWSEKCSNQKKLTQAVPLARRTGEGLGVRVNPHLTSHSFNWFNQFQIVKEQGQSGLSTINYTQSTHRPLLRRVIKMTPKMEKLCFCKSLSTIN